MKTRKENERRIANIFILIHFINSSENLHLDFLLFIAFFVCLTALWSQEFYINVLLSNLSSLIKNQVDEEIQITAKSTNKYRYQANRAFIIGRIKTIVPKILCNLFDLSAIDRLYKESLRCRSQIMPGRTFRRKKNKAIGRTHFNNKKVAF